MLTLGSFLTWTPAELLPRQLFPNLHVWNLLFLPKWVFCSCPYWITSYYFKPTSNLSRLFWILFLSSKTLAFSPELGIIRKYSLFQHPVYSYWSSSMASPDYWSSPLKSSTQNSKRKLKKYDIQSKHISGKKNSRIRMKVSLHTDRAAGRSVSG